MANPTSSTSDVASEITKWFRKQIPGSWFAAPAEARIDREEILVIGSLTAEAATESGAQALAEKTAILNFREVSREDRVEIAQRAEALFSRKVSWAVSCGGSFAPFTTLSIPVMTRLRMDQRQILDTLVGSGVARSRSDALAWCVGLVAEHEAEWLAELRSAVVEVSKVRDKGPR
jgi:hypothetical protein